MQLLTLLEKTFPRNNPLTDGLFKLYFPDTGALAMIHKVHMQIHGMTLLTEIYEDGINMDDSTLRPIASYQINYG